MSESCSDDHACVATQGLLCFLSQREGCGLLAQELDVWLPLGSGAVFRLSIALA